MPVDEDGVMVPGALVAGSATAIRIAASTPGRLDAFLDWNRDGDWNDPGERVTSPDGTPLVAGLNVLTIPVPAAAARGTAWARFRFSDIGGLGPTGSAAKGEIEDYPTVLIKPITLTTRLTGGSLEVSWDAESGAVLETAETIFEPWNEITNATIPYVVGLTGAHGFFRGRMTIP